jgi:hypothetical protein
MARQRTKAELVERTATLERENTLLSYGLSVMANGDTPVHTERWRGRDKSERYEARLYHPTAPHGGIVVVRFSYPNQRDSFDVRYAEEWCSDQRDIARVLGDFDRMAVGERMGRALRRAQTEGSSASVGA